MAPSKLQVLKLYKTLLRESSKFSSYNFRMYGLRKVKDTFIDNKKLSDPSMIEQKYNDGLRQLEVVKRQVLVGNLYKTDNLVIEK